MSNHFEWNSAQAKTNLAKHEVSFEEASTVFDDPMFITVGDDEHPQDEQRYITIGLSKDGQLLMVAHTERDNRIRIIGARKATANEKNSTPKQDDYELKEEYDLSKMTVLPRGRFAPERRMGKNVAVLAPDVALAFPNDDAVNEALRLVLKAAKIPQQQRQMAEEKADYK